MNCDLIDKDRISCKSKGKSFECRRKNAGKSFSCKQQSDGGYDCNMLDFVCYTDKGNYDVISTGGRQYFYFFSYASNHFHMISEKYQKFYKSSMPSVMEDVMLKGSKPGHLKNYSRNYWGSSKYGNTGSVATLHKNPGKHVKGIIMLLPIEMIPVLDKFHEGSTEVRIDKYRQEIVKVSVMSGKTETSVSGTNLNCLTYVGNTHQDGVSLSQVMPAERYLVQIATMLRDRRTLMGANEYSPVYRLDIRRNEENNSTSCYYYRYGADNQFTSEPCSTK